MLKGSLFKFPKSLPQAESIPIVDTDLQKCLFSLIEEVKRQAELFPEYYKEGFEKTYAYVLSMLPSVNNTYDNNRMKGDIIKLIGRIKIVFIAANSVVPEGVYGRYIPSRRRIELYAVPIRKAFWHASFFICGTIHMFYAMAASNQMAKRQSQSMRALQDILNTHTHAIATVDENGLVTAISAGTATITVKTADGNKTATCAITVISPTVLINNNPGTKTINYGEELKLKATVTNLPEGAEIVWYVDGVEKGRGDEFTAPAGTADYTVTVKIVNKDGNIIKNAENKEITAEEKVTVKAGFFQKLINFFKNLFGAIRTVPQVFKEF